MNFHFTMETSVSKGLLETSTFLWLLDLNYKCGLSTCALKSQGKTLTIYLTLRTYLSIIVCFGCSFSNTPDAEKPFHSTQQPGQSRGRIMILCIMMALHDKDCILHSLILQEINKTC